MAKFKQNVPTDFNNNMERLTWSNHDEISQQFLRALPNHDGMMLNNVMREAVRNYLGPKFHPGRLCRWKSLYSKKQGGSGSIRDLCQECDAPTGRLHSYAWVDSDDDNGHVEQSESLDNKGTSAHVSRSRPKRISPPVL